MAKPMFNLALAVLGMLITGALLLASAGYAGQAKLTSAAGTVASAAELPVTQLDFAVVDRPVSRASWRQKTSLSSWKHAGWQG